MAPPIFPDSNISRVIPNQLREILTRITRANSKKNHLADERVTCSNHTASSAIPTFPEQAWGLPSFNRSSNYTTKKFGEAGVGGGTSFATCYLTQLRAASHLA
ncbi:MAG: hypothetical protein QF676_05045 [Dehalococcoidia bacterium]|nr:hypothetical protein [Chloroflexota bacterium]MDP7261945.1 hypothetical protein [Dehalococcoidia bacterium]